MEIVEDQDEWDRPTEVLDQCSDRSVTSMAFVLSGWRRGPRQASGRRKYLRELRQDTIVQHAQATWVEARQMIVERVDEHRERNVPLEFGCDTGQDGMPTRLRARPKLRQKSGLADSRLTDERDRTPVTSIQLIQ
jgi:hypothetical protein